MVTYECDKCKKSFKHKGDFTKHINRQKSCIIETPIKSFKEQLDDKNNIIIELENKIKEKDELLLKTIKEKNEIIEQKNKEIHELLTKQIKKSKRESTQIINGDVQNIQNNINITLARTGTESLSELTDKEKESVLNAGYKCVLNIFSKIHNNSRLPKYKNICISNRRANGGYIYDNGWIYMTCPVQLC